MEPGAPPGPPPGTQGASSSPSAGAVSDAEVRTFAEIQVELASLRTELAQRIQAGADQAELETRFQTRAAEIVQSSELSATRFNEIAVRVEQDDRLRRRIQEVINRQMVSES
jgi:hypothetical protein